MATRMAQHCSLVRLTVHNRLIMVARGVVLTALAACFVSYVCVGAVPHTQVPAAVAKFPAELWSSKLRRIALGDWLARKLAAEANRASAAAAGQSQGWHGAKGGDVCVDLPGGSGSHIGTLAQWQNIRSWHLALCEVQADLWRLNWQWNRFT